MNIDRCPRCGATAPVFEETDRGDIIRYYCRTRVGGCGKVITRKKVREKNGRKPLGDRAMTPSEKVARCIPKLPYTKGCLTWYVVSKVIGDGTATVFECLEHGTLKTLDKKYPDHQVLAVSEYPAAKQRKYKAMIEAAQVLEDG
jgi:hypothetical protein